MILVLNAAFTCLLSSQMTSNLKETKKENFFFLNIYICKCIFHVNVNTMVSHAVRTRRSSSYTPGFRRRTDEPLFRV